MLSCLFNAALWSPAGKELTSWLSCVWCFITFLCDVLWCGTWLYWFLIFASLLTLNQWHLDLKWSTQLLIHCAPSYKNKLSINTPLYMAWRLWQQCKIYLLNGVIHLPSSMLQRGDLGSQHTYKFTVWSQWAQSVSLLPGQPSDISSNTSSYNISSRNIQNM